MERRLNDIFDIVLEFKNASSFEDVHHALLRRSSTYGISSFLVGTIPRHNVTKEEMLAHLLLGKWPDQWAGRYFENHYIRVDPTIRHCLTSATGLMWSEARPADTLGNRVMSECGEFGLRQGLTIPLTSWGGVRLASSFGGDKIDQSPYLMDDMLFLASFAIKRALELDATPKVLEIKLTPREREALAWAATGKSMTDISDIMMVSDSTIDKFLSSARLKLGAINTTQAVANALRAGVLG